MARRMMPTAFDGVFDGNDASAVLDRPTHASYIRACKNCVRAKAKCSTSVNIGGKCERCHRMNKECHPSPPMRKRRTVARPSASKTSKLEEKVDGLVTLLKSATQGVPGIINAASVNSALGGIVPAGHESASSSMAASSGGYQDYTYNESLPGGNGPLETNYTPSTSSPSWSPEGAPKPILHPSLEPSSEDADSYLNRFRTDFVKHLPFIIISPSMTAHQLRQERPILWVSIMCVASTNTTQQIKLSKEMREIFGREAYVEGTKSMDLLLAALVYAAWDRCYCFDKPIFTILVQLAIAMLYELGLDKPASKDSALILVYDLKGARKPSRFSRSPTMEERRALLGCFLVSSVTSYMRRGATLRWTTYSEECLRVIETEKEFTSDALLVQIVKLRLISERVVDAPWCGATVAEVDHSLRPPAVFYLKSLEAQLRDFKSNIPSELADNKTLLMQLHVADLSIHEVGLSHAPDIFSGQYNRRFECLYACLNAAKSWVDVFLGIPPAQYVGFSALIYSGMMHFFIDIYRLSIFTHPEWDQMLVRENLDVSNLLEQSEKNLMQVKEAALFDIGGSEDIDSFTILATKCRALKTSWEAATSSATAPLSNTAPTDEMGDFPMSLLDDDWLSYLSGPWNT